MLAFEGKAGLGAMIEGFAVKTNHGEFLTVMLHMAADAVRLAG